MTVRMTKKSLATVGVSAEELLICDRCGHRWTPEYHGDRRAPRWWQCAVCNPQARRERRIACAPRQSLLHSLWREDSDPLWVRLGVL
jgi:hypothetical protein